MQKKGYIFLLLFIGFACIAWHPYTHSTSLKDKGLKGPVKMVIENVQNWAFRNIIVQNYDIEGRLIEIRYFVAKREIVNYNSDSTIHLIPEYINPYYDGLDTNEFAYSHCIRYKYNLKGNPVIQELIERAGKKHFHEEYLYNANDSLIKKSLYNYDSLEIIVDSSIVLFDYVIRDNVINKLEINKNDTISTMFYLDTKGRVMKKSSFNNLTYGELYIVKSYYNKNGQITEEIHLSRDQIVKKTVYKYRIDKLLKKESIKSYSDGHLELYSLNKFSYNRKKRKKIQQFDIYYDSDGKTKSTVKTNINRCGNAINHEVVDFELMKNYTNEYKYDEYCNWTKMYNYKNGVLEDSISRIIKYHKKNEH